MANTHGLVLLTFAVLVHNLDGKKLTIGVLLEKPTKLEKQTLNSTLRMLSTPSLAFEYYSNVNPYLVVQKMCRLIDKGVHLFISGTSCSIQAVIESLINELHLVHIAVASWRCQGSFNKKSDLKNSKWILKGNNLSRRPEKTTSLDEALGDIVRIEQWTSVIVFYDQTVDRQRAVNIRDHVFSNRSSLVKFHEIKLFIDTTDDTRMLKSRLSDIFKDGEFFNFIVAASPSHTITIIQNAEVLGVKGKNYNWLIANQEIRLVHLQAIGNTTRAVAVIRESAGSESNFKQEVYFERELELYKMAVNAMSSVVTNTSKHYSWAEGISCNASPTIEFQDSISIIKHIKRQLSQESSKVKDNQVLEIYRSPEKHLSSNDWTKVGEWKPEIGLNLSQDIGGRVFQTGYSSLNGMHLRIVTIVEQPFVIRKNNPGGDQEFDGCCIDILHAIQSDLEKRGEKFTYSMYSVQDDNYGIVNETTKKWIGLVGDVLYKSADLAVAGMIRNYKREKFVDFTSSYMDYGVGILIPKPQKTTSIFGFLEPLTVQVWICIAVATFAVGLMLFVLSRLSPLSRFNQLGTNEFSFKNSMWFALASLMQQGGDATPLSISGRILGTFWWFFTLIIIATYTANLAAFLTVTRMETQIESLADLAAQTRLRYGTVKDSSLQTFFKEQNEGGDKLYTTIWQYMTENNVMVKTQEEGIERVMKGNYAFMWDAPVLEYQRKLNCDKLATVGKPFNKKNYAFAMPKGAPYLETFTLSILRLQESGELDKIKQKWFEGESHCADEDSLSSGKEAEGIALKNVAGVFYILLMGAGLSFFTALIELVWHKYLRSSQ